MRKRGDFLTKIALVRNTRVSSIEKEKRNDGIPSSSHGRGIFAWSPLPILDCSFRHLELRSTRRNAADSRPVDGVPPTGERGNGNGTRVWWTMDVCSAARARIGGAWAVRACGSRRVVVCARAPTPHTPGCSPQSGCPTIGSI